jgi:hypothetical protein
MIESRFVTPGLSGPERTSADESVTADMIFFRTSSGRSVMNTVAAWLGSDLDIFAVGSCNDMMREPTLEMKGSGTLKVSE